MVNPEITNIVWAIITVTNRNEFSRMQCTDPLEQGKQHNHFRIVVVCADKALDSAH